MARDTTFYLTTPEHTALLAVCRDRGLCRGSLVRQALERSSAGPLVKPRGQGSVPVFIYVNSDILDFSKSNNLRLSDLIRGRLFDFLGWRR